MPSVARRAVPWSLLKPAWPFPAMVFTMPSGVILRTRSLALLATYRLPQSSKAIPAGWLNCALEAGPPIAAETGHPVGAGDGGELPVRRDPQNAVVGGVRDVEVARFIEGQ